MTKDIFASEITYNPGSLPAQYMSKREYFAAMAMQGILAQGEYDSSSQLAVDSVIMSDALIKALNEIQP